MLFNHYFVNPKEKRKFYATKSQMTSIVTVNIISIITILKVLKFISNIIIFPNF